MGCTASKQTAKLTSKHTAVLQQNERITNHTSAKKAAPVPSSTVVDKTDASTVASAAKSTSYASSSNQTFNSPKNAEETTAVQHPEPSAPTAAHNTDNAETVEKHGVAVVEPQEEENAANQPAPQDAEVLAPETQQAQCTSDAAWPQENEQSAGSSAEVAVEESSASQDEYHNAIASPRVSHLALPTYENVAEAQLSTPRSAGTPHHLGNDFAETSDATFVENENYHYNLPAETNTALEAHYLTNDQETHQPRCAVVRTCLANPMNYLPSTKSLSSATTPLQNLSGKWPFTYCHACQPATTSDVIFE